MDHNGGAARARRRGGGRGGGGGGGGTAFAPDGDGGYGGRGGRGRGGGGRGGGRGGYSHQPHHHYEPPQQHPQQQQQGGGRFPFHPDGGGGGRGGRGGGRRGRGYQHPYPHPHPHPHPRRPSAVEQELQALQSPVNFTDPGNPVVVRVRIDDVFQCYMAQHQHPPRGGSSGGSGTVPAFRAVHQPSASASSGGGNGAGGGKKRRRVFSDHLSAEEALAGVSAGVLFRGRLRLNPRNSRVAYVTPEPMPGLDGLLPLGVGMDIMLEGPKERNRALEGDVVAVRLHGAELWGGNKRREGQGQGRQGNGKGKKGQGALEGAMAGLALDADDEDEDEEGSEAGAAPADAEGDADEEVDYQRVPLLPSLDAAGEPPLASDARDEPLAEAWDGEGLQALWRPRVRVDAHQHGGAAAGVGAASSDPRLPKELAALLAAARRADGSLPQPTGRVVCVLETKHKTELVGRLKPQTPVGPNEPLNEKDAVVDFVPSDPRAPPLLVPRLECPFAFLQRPHDYRDKIFLVRIKKRWNADSARPFGENARCIGQAGAIDPETDALLRENGVDHGEHHPSLLYDSLQGVLGPAILPPPPAAPPGKGTGGGGKGKGTPTPPPGPSAEDEARLRRIGQEWAIPPEEIARRRDFRGHRVFTIDPTTAKDLDDALHIIDLGDGLVEVGVHIADVSYFVREGTPLDSEAARRATTVYLVQKVVPMLPPLLCEQLCSLNPGVDRLAFSVVWRMRTDGTLPEGDTPPWFGRSVIRSCAKLDYGTAQRLVDADDVPQGPDPAIPASLEWEPARRPAAASTGIICWEVQRDVRLLQSVAMARRAKRFGAGGALALNRCKLSFRLDPDGNPASFAEYPIRDSNRCVEEYMLLANYLVAERLCETMGPRAFIRRHPPPAPRAAAELEALVRAQGFADFDMGSSGALQASLLRLAERGVSPDTIRAITALATHPMRPAEYLAAGSQESSVHWRHFALNIPYYTHFTSPIRRYADVLVHRLLMDSLTAEQTQGQQSQTQIERSSCCSLDVAALQAQARQCNEKKLAAKNAQEASDRLYLCVYLAARGEAGLEAEGVVVGLGAKSFTVLVPSLDLEHRLFLGDIPGLASSGDGGDGNGGGGELGESAAGAKALTLRPQPGQELPWGAAPWTLHLFDRVRMRASSKADAVPLMVRLELLGPAA